MSVPESKTKKSSVKILKKWILGVILPVILIGGLYFLQKILLHFPRVGEAYSTTFYVWLTFIPSKIVSLIPISLTEVLVVTTIFSSPLLIAWFLVRFVRALKKKEGKRFWFRTVRILAWVLCILYADFMLFHGLNYTRRTLPASLGFGQRDYSVEELEEVYAWVVSELNATRMQCTENEKGVLDYPGGVNGFLKDVPKIYQESALTFPSIAGNVGRPKPVALSHYWIYTDIVGMYFPFFAECNVNKDVQMVEMIGHAFHEVSHLNGYAVENNANLASLVLRLNCDVPEVRYSALYEAVGMVEDDLSKALNGDRKKFREITGQASFCDGFFRDIEAVSEYWLSIDPPPLIQEVSNTVNDSFLKANQQEEGVKTYRMASSTLADYYYLYVKGV